MSADYTTVSETLAKGADPAMLCTTCPWDRICITPPTMTRADVDARIAEASQQDDAKASAARAMGAPPPMPGATLMTALVYAGKDITAQVCPVFVLRLRSSSGRKIADSVRASMQGWDDES